jgi:hypothetical protein
MAAGVVEGTRLQQDGEGSDEEHDWGDDEEQQLEAAVVRSKAGGRAVRVKLSVRLQVASTTICSVYAVIVADEVFWAFEKEIRVVGEVMIGGGRAGRSRGHVGVAQLWLLFCLRFNQI